MDSGLGAPSSQELLTAWGAALLGVLRAPWSHVGAMPGCTSQGDDGADATSGVTAALGGGPTALHPQDRRAVTLWCDPKLSPPSLPAPRPPVRNIPSHPWGPAQPRAAEQGLPKIAHSARPLVLLTVGWGWGEPGAPDLPFTAETCVRAGARRCSPTPQAWPLGRGCKPLSSATFPASALPPPLRGAVGNP